MSLALASERSFRDQNELNKTIRSISETSLTGKVVRDREREREREREGERERESEGEIEARESKKFRKRENESKKFRLTFNVKIPIFIVIKKTGV